MGRLVIRTLRAARKAIVLVVGWTVVLVGVVLLFTPGPAFVVIPAGLAILATEFIWARRLLSRIRSHGESFVRAAGRRPKPDASREPDPP
jgi:uncharacterized protein (TIGR02611 family)